jgi:hypothetical protein
MANTIITPTVISRTGLATLYNTIVLAALVWRDFDADFTAKQGNTVDVRKPAVFEAEEFDRATGTQAQAIEEEEVPVKLDTIANVTVAVTDEEMTLAIEDFQVQVLNGMMEAIAQKVDGDLADELTEAARGSGQLATMGEDPANTAYRLARQILSRRKFPKGDRNAALSPEGVSAVLGDKLLVAANESGTTDALREAALGRIYGINNYETQEFGDAVAGPRGEADGVAFHKTAVALVVRPLNTPKGLATEQVSIESFKGLSLRTVYAYNAGEKQDEVSVDLLYGIETLREEGAVELDFGVGS